ncbi:MAG: aldehyde dehydrogenase family protein [Acidobacteria bacterium]|nr:aldehyde dehydrogenase family protein [Acidobacteriota bacterium]
MASIADTLRSTYDSGHTRPLEWRRRQLEQMKRMLEENEAEFLDALRTDLGKPAVEGFITDIAFVTSELDAMIKNLRKWNKPERVGTPLVTMPAKSHLVPEPLGVVLVIAPWNYPIQLLLVPAAGAIAAGNCVVMKPSEVSSATSAALGRLVPKYMDPAAVAIVEGGVPETTDLLGQRFDHIFYTGNGTVGRVVMAAAVANLTPVTLELGGKSPVIIDESADLRVAARRIAWGKWLNAGQTCVAPDYILVPESKQDALVAELRTAIGEFYGEDPHLSDSYGRIVSPRHFDRLESLMAGGTPAVGGDTKSDERYIAPTVLVDVDPDSQLMAEEIFGPLLPIIPVTSVAESIAFINARPHPLALYVFAENKSVIDTVLTRTTAGGVTVNGTLMHLTNPNLPFGGIGESGMGGYHGKAGVRLFQHLKPVLTRGTKLDPSIAYPPYTARKAKIFRRVL